MHRALGGAPTSPVHRSAPVGRGLTWRSLGRSLLANFRAGSAWLAAYNNKKIYGRGVRPRLKLSLPLKNKNFFRKELGPSCAKIRAKN